MGSVIVYTLSKAFMKVVYNSVGHFLWNGSNFLMDCIFKLFNRLIGRLLYTFDFRYPKRKKSHRFKSGCVRSFNLTLYLESVCVCIYHIRYKVWHDSKLFRVAFYEYSEFNAQTLDEVGCIIIHARTHTHTHSQVCMCGYI